MVIRKADGRVEVTEYPVDGAGENPLTPGVDRWLRRILEVCEAPDRELGRREIGGRDAIGFEVAGWRLAIGAPSQAKEDGEASDSWVRLWVDVETKLPVEMEINQVSVTVASRMVLHASCENMSWDVPLARADFEPPAATSPEAVRQMNLPAATEASFIRAVEDWRGESERIGTWLAELKDAPNLEQLRGLTRPDAVNPPSVELNELMSIDAARTAATKAYERAQAKARGEWTEPEAASLQSVTEAPSYMAVWMFFHRLVMDGADPVYDPAALGAEDVLLRWRLDEEHERVIYGDLRVETVPLAP
jgi:hypothetical protein